MPDVPLHRVVSPVAAAPGAPITFEEKLAVAAGQQSRAGELSSVKLRVQIRPRCGQFGGIHPCRLGTDFLKELADFHIYLSCRLGRLRGVRLRADFPLPDAKGKETLREPLA